MICIFDKIVNYKDKDLGKMSEFAVVYVTVPNEELGEKLSKGLLENKLCACVNRTNVLSMFTWKNQIEKDQELLLIIKTRASLLDKLTSFVKQNHTYEVPEVIAIPIIYGNKDYLQWIRDNTLNE